MFACASDGDVELAVDKLIVEGDRGAQERQLIGRADGRGVNDDVTLRPLIALDSVDVYQ